MLSPKSIIPECCIDSCLFDVLLNFEKQSVNHTKGNGSVVKKIEDKFENLFCIAIVDKDKRPLSFLKTQCRLVDIGGFEYYFLLYKRENYYHYIIQIVPEIETWILNVSEKLDLELGDFEINAKNLRELCWITKKIVSKDDPRFKSYFKGMLTKANELNFEPVLKLQNVVKFDFL